MNFIIDENIISTFQGVKIGVLTCKNAGIRRDDPHLDEIRKETFQYVLENFGSKPVTELPNIRSWRTMYRRFGTKPGDYRPSAEALLRRVLRGRGLPSINTVVDSYNLVSLKYLIPMGGLDLDEVVGDIRLRFSAGGERFLPIGSSMSEKTYEGEVVYADDERILTRRWNHRDCEETKITERTKNIILFADGSDEITVEAVNTAMEDLSSVLSRICGGEMSFKIVEGNCRTLNI